MEPTAGVTHIGAETARQPPGTGSIRPLGIFADWRLQAYGYTVAALYAAMLYYWYRLGVWFVDRSGAPSVNDFTVFWIAGKQALHLGVAATSGSMDFASIEKIVLGPAYRADSFYPPIFLLVEAPLALLPYGPAFLGLQAITLAASAVVVFLIVRRRAAVALAFSSPFGVINILNGQTGFLRGALLGAALLTLERNPVLGGVFFGCLVYKPQFGILIPVGLAAARQWRALASAALTALFLAGASIAIFGIGPWEKFPPALLAQAGHYLLPVHPRIETWVGIQSTYGTLRALGGSADLAWFMQGCVTAGAAVVVWLVWRSRVRYPLKAAILSIATLMATPYVWYHDLAVIVIPAAFLAKDQIDHGLLRGEQTVIILLVVASLAAIPLAGHLSLGAPIVLAVFGLVLRRIVSVPRADRYARIRLGLE